MPKSWNSSYKISKSSIVRVKSEDDIVNAVLKAIDQKSRVRAMGSLYTFANIVSPTKSKSGKDVVLDMQEYRRLVAVDKKNCTITVEGGMKIHELIHHLENNGLSLSNYGNVTGQSVAGVISTGTHGESVKYGSFSSQVKSLRFVNGYGKIVEADFTSQEPKMVHLCNAIGVSVGMLGIITQVTLQCEKLFYLRKSEYSVSYDELMAVWDKLHAQADYVEVTYFPIVDRFTIGVASRLVDDAGRKSFEALRPKVKRNPPNMVDGGNIAGVYLLSMLSSMIDQYTWGRKILTRVFKRLKKLQPDEHKQRFYASIAADVIADKSNVNVKHKEFEVVVPFESSKQVIEKLHEFYQNNPQYITMYPVDFRASKKERFYLSGTHSGDGLWIDFIIPIASVHSFPRKELHELFKPFGARRHWGKLSQLEGGEAVQLYGKDLSLFLDARKTHDPLGLFRNKELDKILHVDDGLFHAHLPDEFPTNDENFSNSTLAAESTSSDDK
ncbi:hypothetical protein HK103_005128 [Boothiomyces macroporosus]|uniref:D-arabinono-1,4-lactone oxidase n=1 Tax=Boothiomyces macroporosus TaxID=261099 RepID=A0AAD5UIC7_9FUNG|nr:hypothetical protein HK103_005128 [Boothiomyces macroporosus]